MRKLSEQQLIDAISAEKTFHAQIEDGSFEVKLNSYVPYIGTAIHAGHRMREELLGNCLLDDAARLLEEDPFTDQMVQDFPITLVGCDSRYEYDLNRGPDDCVYGIAWGVKVWREPLTDALVPLSPFHSYSGRALGRSGRGTSGRRLPTPGRLAT